MEGGRDGGRDRAGLRETGVERERESVREGGERYGGLVDLEMDGE